MSTLTLFYQDVQKISGYTVVEEIHAKATTRIYKVRTNADYFALKIVDQSSKPQRIKRFQRELQFLQMFADASGIPRVYKYGNIHNNPYYVMEYVEGPSLTTHVNKKQRLSEQEALKIIKNLCVVVKQIHEKQVFHCNLSPANILFSQEQIFVLGFGACIHSVELTKNVEITGRLHYLSPEQVNGNYDKLGPWSDAYSLGAVLYFLLTGDAPFDAPSEVEVIHNLATCNLRSITDYDIQISQKCEAILERALLQDIHHRYQNINELLVDVMCCFDLQGSTDVTIAQDSFDNSSIFSREPTHLPPQGIIPNFEPNPMIFANEVPATTALPPTESRTEIKPFLPTAQKSEDIADEKPLKRPRTKTKRYAKMQGDRPRHRKNKNNNNNNNKNNNNRSKNYMHLLVSFSVGIVISFIFIYPFLPGDSTQKQSANIEKPRVEETPTVATGKESKPETKNVAPQVPKPQEESNYQTLSKVSSMHKARWRLQNGIWVGTAQQPFGLMTIADFPHWKNYEFKADVLIKEGQLGIFVRNFTQTAQFPNFLGQMGIFPYKDRWFSVTAVANGNQLLIKIDNTDRRLTRFSIPSANPGVVGFGLAPERANKPALAYVKNIRMKKLPQDCRFEKGRNLAPPCFLKEMKDILFFISIFALWGCSGEKNVGVDVAVAGVSNAVDLSYQSSLSQNFAKPTPQRTSRPKKKRSQKPTIKAKSVVGSWETRDGNFHIQFYSGGKGVATHDRQYNGHLYTYYRNFLWKQKNTKISLKYTSETTIRDGIHIVREKTLSEKTTFRASDNQLSRTGSTLYRK